MLDLEEKCVRLFGEYNRSIPFEDLYLLPIFIDGKEVLWVKEGEIVFGNEAYETVANLTADFELDTEPRYFHTTQEGYLKVPDIKLVLAGRRDSKPVDDFGVDVFKKSSNLRKYIIDGVIEIIPESRAKVLKKQVPNAQSRDKALDELIVKTSVNDILEQDDFFDDADEVNSSQGEVETETDQILKKIDHLRTKRE